MVSSADQVMRPMPMLWIRGELARRDGGMSMTDRLASFCALHSFALTTDTRSRTGGFARGTL